MAGLSDSTRSSTSTAATPSSRCERMASTRARRAASARATRAISMARFSASRTALSEWRKTPFFPSRSAMSVMADGPTTTSMPCEVRSRTAVSASARVS